MPSTACAKLDIELAEFGMHSSAAEQAHAAYRSTAPLLPGR